MALDDVLGELLGETLRLREGQPLFETVERVRALSKSGRSGDDAGFETLAKLLSELPVESAVPVARAFAHFLTLANIAEQHHRIRRRREYQRESARPQPASCEEAFGRLVRSGIEPDALFAALARWSKPKVARAAAAASGGVDACRGLPHSVKPPCR